jgi:hypothetical protein
MPTLNIRLAQNLLHTCPQNRHRVAHSKRAIKTTRKYLPLGQAGIGKFLLTFCYIPSLHCVSTKDFRNWLRFGSGIIFL